VNGFLVNFMRSLSVVISPISILGILTLIDDKLCSVFSHNEQNSVLKIATHAYNCDDRVVDRVDISLIF
jgi:hypothetical protein